MTDRELRMVELIQAGVWPTASKIGDRRDLNGRECRFRERLATRYGWERVSVGRVTRWVRRGGS